MIEARSFGVVSLVSGSARMHPYSRDTKDCGVQICIQTKRTEMPSAGKWVPYIEPFKLSLSKAS